MKFVKDVFGGVVFFGLLASVLPYLTEAAIGSRCAPPIVHPDRGLAGIALLAQPALAATGAGQGRADFDTRWHDGKAELNGYRLTVERYGHPRIGRAVLIYVTEPFSRSKHVKVDDPSKNPADTFDALKLNLVRHFQTGVYDYSTMVSLFTRSSDFVPVKATFTSAEWCGQVYEELNFDGARLAERFFSYFENESSEQTLPAPADGVVEDNLFILLRGLREDFLAPGQKRSVPFLASAFYRRLTHQTLAWSTATIERLSGSEMVRVPAGTFEAWVYVVKPADGREGRFFIEREDPHRVLRWAWAPPPKGATGRAHLLGGTDSGELTGSSRLQYWKLHDPGDETYLEALGLQPAAR